MKQKNIYKELLKLIRLPQIELDARVAYVIEAVVRQIARVHYICKIL